MLRLLAELGAGGMCDAEDAGGEPRPPPWRDKADAHPRSIATAGNPSGGALSLPSPWGDFALQRRAAAPALRPGRGAHVRVRWWALLAFLVLLPCASPPAAHRLPCGSRTAPVLLITAASAVVPGMLITLTNAARGLHCCPTSERSRAGDLLAASLLWFAMPLCLGPSRAHGWVHAVQGIDGSSCCSSRAFSAC